MPLYSPLLSTCPLLAVTGVKGSILSGNWLGEKEIKAYRDFLKEEEKEINLIRKTTSTGRPLGREQFIKVIEKILDREILPKKAGRPRKGTRKISGEYGKCPSIFPIFPKSLGFT